MAVIDFVAVSKELTNELRNSDCLTVSERGVTTGTSNQTGNGVLTSFLVNVNNAKNVRSVTVASVTMTYGTEWNFDTDYDDSGTIKLRITFTNAPADQAAIVISYDYGPDKIWDDTPRLEYKLADMPRVHWEYGAGRSEEVDSNAAMIRTTQLVSATVLATDVAIVNRVITTIRSHFKTRRKLLYTVKLIRFAGMGPNIVAADRYNDVIQRNVDFTLTFDLEE